MKSVMTNLEIVILTLNTPAALSAENPTTNPMAGNPATMGVMGGNQMPGMDPQQLQEMMGKRMDMMQMMMEQMMQHDQMNQVMPMR